jgi:hypothetical protein
MRRQIFPFKKSLRKSLVSDSVGCDGPGPSWPRKSMVSGSAGLGGSRVGSSSWLRKSLVSGSAGRGGDQ